MSPTSIILIPDFSITERYRGGISYAYQTKSKSITPFAKSKLFKKPLNYS